MTGNPQISPNFVNFNWNFRKTIQTFAKFWNWNPATTAVVLLENPEIFRHPIQCCPWGGGGGGGIFSGIAQYWI